MVASLMLTLGVALPARADYGEDLFKKYRCQSRHQPDKKLTAPSIEDIAEKYKGDAGAPARLAGIIKAGGGGVWDLSKMPANPNIPNADAAAITAWMLAH